MKKILNSILIKPAGPDCNMACDYCFYLNKKNIFPKTDKHRMKNEILKEMIRQMMAQADSNVSFGWQGGEPTLMGIEFFRNAVELQKKYGSGQNVSNGLQTNGILINRDWAKLFKEYNFLIGLSLDGPEHVHDKYRKKTDGSGSWKKVFDTAKMLLDHGVKVNALIVVNDFSVLFPEQIYEFHKSLGLTYMQFIPCIEPDINNPEKAADFSTPSRDYGNFLNKLFDLWWDDFKNGIPTTSIRYFESIFHTYAGVPPPLCTLLPECGNYLVVEHDGGVYSCDFFVEADWHLGNLMDGKLIDMLNSEKQQEFGINKKIENKKCYNCRWKVFCRGGCPKDRRNNPEGDNLSFFCLSYEMFFEHAHKRLSEFAESWTRRQRVLSDIRKTGVEPSRNDPCPCKSGKKFKKCCGRNF